MSTKDLLREDIGFFDLTTEALGIADLRGEITFEPKQEMILCGLRFVKETLKELNLESSFLRQDGERVKKGEVFLRCHGRAGDLHALWKVAQNIFEYSSGIATYTSDLLGLVEHKISVLTTRKNLPNAKEFMQRSVFCGGGAPHRLGTYDSVLIFSQHLEFLHSSSTLESSFRSLKKRLIEKKIAVEVESFAEASYFADLGADILQCEKMSIDELRECVLLKQKHPSLVVVATGGINHTNIKEYALTGIDAVVTSSPYHAKPLDVKVRMRRVV